MFYSAWDKQCGRYMATGLNSETKEECMEDVFIYLIEDDGTQEDEENFSQMTNEEKEDFILANEIEIEEHKEKIEEE
jgi:hypothetical protein